MSETDVKIRGYRTPSRRVHQRHRGHAGAVRRGIGIIRAAMHYWDGPVEKRLVLGADQILKHEVMPVYSREAWLESDERHDWLESLTDEQRQMLAQCCRPRN